MSHDLQAERIQRVLRESRRGPMKPRDIARTLGVRSEEYPSFRRQLRDLELQGLVYKVRGKRYAVPASIDLVVGTLEVTRRGHGFLVTGEGRDDILVPEEALETAMDGDRAAVRIEGRSRGRRYGRVVRILERAHPTVVGAYQAHRRFGTLRPADRALPRDILIPEGEAGAARDGDLVRVEIVSYGSSRAGPVGRVLEVLGQEGEPGVDVLAIIHSHGLPASLPPGLGAAARAAVEAAERRPEADRQDRTDLHVVTIDPADARDHDDALSVQELEGGLVRVGVHIADVAHYVTAGSEVDLEALRRGTSVYLVDRVLPMLPEALSADACSLVPGEPRRVVTVYVDFDAKGAVVGHRFERSWIRSRHRLSYEEAQESLTGSRSLDPATDAALQRLDWLAGVLRRARKLRGSIDFDVPEARVVLEEGGSPIQIERRARFESHRLVEDFMLLANETIAREGSRKGWPLLFRVHHSPDPDRLDKLRELLSGVGYTLPERVSPGALQKVLERAEGRPEQALVATSVLRAMMRARYASTDDGHYGLAAQHYAHFTSPIRRYPDLHVHRVLAADLFGAERGAEAWTEEALASLAEHVSRRERVADEAERDSVELKKIEYMERHLGDDLTGRISSVVPFGFFVVPDDVFAEGLVHVSSLADDFYHFHERSLALVGERRGRIFRIGDPVTVRVARVDRSERRIDLVLAEDAAGGAYGAV
ncbi:MAG: ribonuclease R [Gemmatimonadota bacterium]